MASEKTDHQHPVIPETMTPPAWVFHAEYKRVIAFVGYLTRVASSADEKAKIAIQALYQERDPEKYHKELDHVERQGATQVLRRRHRTLVLEMMLSRAADNFLAYITELLVMVFRCRPETLRSSETVRLDAILRHTTMPELIHELAERRVHQLSYQGMRELASYLSERLGFDLVQKPEDLEHAIWIIEARNIIVHNRGIVNELFLKRTSGRSVPIGESLQLDTDQIFDDLEFIARSVYGIDQRAVQKFNLSPVRDPSV
jgi:hypothetical protein